MTDEMTDTGRTLVKVYEIYIRTTPAVSYTHLTLPTNREV